MPPLKRGSRIKSITLSGYKSTGGTASLQLYTVTTGAWAVETETAVGSSVTTTTSGNYTLQQTYTRTVAAGESFRLSVTLPANTDSVWCVSIGYDTIA